MRDETRAQAEQTYECNQDPDDVMHILRQQVLAAIGQATDGHSPMPRIDQEAQPGCSAWASVADDDRVWRELRHKLYLVSESHLVRETPFESHTPVVGPLIAAFRQAWNSVACKWHVRKLVVQQNAFNLSSLQTMQVLVRLIERQQQQLSDQRHEIEALKARLEPNQVPDADEDVCG